jgi:hypothetical protein
MLMTTGEANWWMPSRITAVLSKNDHCFQFTKKIIVKINNMQKFRKLDIFKKVPKDLSEGTDLGGLISIIAALLMVYFIVN